MTIWPVPDSLTWRGPDAIRVLAGKSIGHCILNQEEINALVANWPCTSRSGRGPVKRRRPAGVRTRRARRQWSLHQAGVPFEIVPGVTAGLGALAYAGIPVTHRESSSAVAFVTGHGDPECDPGQSRLDWPALARFPGTLVVYMGVTSYRGDLPHLDSIRGNLATLQPRSIESGTLSSQRTQVGTLNTIAGLAIRRRPAPPCSFDCRIGRRPSGGTGLVRDLTAIRPANFDDPSPDMKRYEPRRSSSHWVRKCSSRPPSKSGPITDSAPLDECH